MRVSDGPRATGLGTVARTHRSPPRPLPFSPWRRQGGQITLDLLVLEAHQPAACARIASHRIVAGSWMRAKGLPTRAGQGKEVSFFPAFLSPQLLRPLCPTEHTGELRDGRMTYAEQRLRSLPARLMLPRGVEARRRNITPPTPTQKPRNFNTFFSVGSSASEARRGDEGD